MTRRPQSGISNGGAINLGRSSSLRRARRWPPAQASSAERGDLSRRARGRRDARNLAEAGSNHLAAAVWMEVAFGNKERALDGARRLLARNPGYDPGLRAALTLAICGCADEAQAIADELTKANPEHTIINSVL